MRFWNRKDVWRTARWFVTPGALIRMWSVSALFRAVHYPLWAELLAAPALGASGPLLIMGVFERYLRRKANERYRVVAGGTESRSKQLPDPGAT